MTRYKPQFPLFILFIPAFLVLILYGYLGGFTRLLADDFCSVHYAKRLGLVRSIWYWYLNWSGRYTAFGVDWLMEELGEPALPILPPLSLLVWVIFTTIAVYLSLRHVLPQGSMAWVSLTLGTLFPFVVLSLSPNVPQSLYWWNGMRSYTLPLILLTIYAVLFQFGVERLKSGRGMIAGSLLSFLFMFANGGLGETYIAFQLALMISLLTLEWVVHRDRNSSRFLFLLAGLFGSAVAMIAVISAPGNAIRQAFFPPHPDVVTLFQISLNGYLDFILEIVKTPEKITGLLGALLGTIWLGGWSEYRSTGNNWIAPVVFLGAFLLSFTCFVPGVYATSELPPTRAFVIPIFILVAGLLCTGFVVGQISAYGRYSSKLVQNFMFVIAILLIIYSASINAGQLYNNRGVYIAFAQKWDETDALVLAAKNNGQESVQIPAMENWAEVEHPTDNERYWPNICYSLYYDIQVYGPPLP
jgi:hypothetical protein